MPVEFKSFARIAPIANLSELARAASHGRRLDPSAKKRVDPERTSLNVAFSPYCPGDPLDLVGAWKIATNQQAAVPYGRAPIAAHLLVGVSPALVDENGSRHDPTNPANIALVRETAAWAEFAFGAGSVIAGRLDVDEHGGGVVDLIVVPIREARMNKHVTKAIVSLPKALEEIQSAHDDETSYGALQSSWAAWAMKHIDPRIRRGTPKVQTAREHVHADAFRYVATACEVELRDEWSKKVEAAQAEVAKTRTEVQADATALAEREAAMEKLGGELEAWRADLAQFEEQHEAEVRQAVSGALDGIKLGIAAFRAGSLFLSETADGRTIVHFPNLAAAEAARLKATLKPAWRAGLLDLLSDLDQQGAVFGRRVPPF